MYQFVFSITNQFYNYDISSKSCRMSSWMFLSIPFSKLSPKSSSISSSTISNCLSSPMPNFFEGLLCDTLTIVPCHDINVRMVPAYFPSKILILLFFKPSRPNSNLNCLKLPLNDSTLVLIVSKNWPISTLTFPSSQTVSKFQDLNKKVLPPWRHRQRESFCL
jgi:hypothetical protein